MPFLFLAAALAVIASVPAWKRWCVARGWLDRPGPRKVHETPVPLAGGLAVLTGMLVALGAAWAGTRLHWINVALFSQPTGPPAHPTRLWILLAGACAMTGLGWVDDRKDLRPVSKFTGQLGIAAVVACLGLELPSPAALPGLGPLLGVLWILTLTNAVNFTDNMNGLCAGLGILGSAAFAASAARTGNPLAAAIGALASGALAGFLPWNFPRATAFLGDAGSHLVGYLLAILSLQSYEHALTSGSTMSPAAVRALLILIVPLTDLGSVVILRWRHGRPFYVGDTNHFSHRLVRRGFSPAQAVAILWGIAAAGAAAAWCV
ncbi:MAG TPA: MraY family glycosyltransferase [Candidatus Saccharimonadales bacterium]|nr:MraY family glycosyltransferase [Candidatus Saccharimonadales bacterium]